MNVEYIELYEKAIEYDRLPFWDAYKNVYTKVHSWDTSGHRKCSLLAIL